MRALVTRPDILLLDEPFAALDEILRQQLNEDLLRIWSEQRWTALFVTHNVTEAVFLSQRVMVMRAHPGRIVKQLEVPFSQPQRDTAQRHSVCAADLSDWPAVAGAGGMTRLISSILPPLLLLVMVLSIWQTAVVIWDIPTYLLPAPSQVWAAGFQRSSQMLMATGITGAGALCGFAASILLGALTALVFSQSQVVRSSCYPYAIFLQTVPIVAIAPLIVTWLGTGFRSVVVISCIISMFPVITNVTVGLITIEPGLHDLFRLHRASRVESWRNCKFPMPFLI